MKKQIVKAIALYGGAFDPPHNGHLAILKNLDSLNFINQIWLLPSGDRSDKKLLFSKDQRFDILGRLVKKYLANNEKVKVIDEQIKLSKQKNRMIPTIQLLQHFDKKYPNYQFHFVIGTDILQTINTWQKYQDLLDEHKFIIYPRRGYQVDIKKTVKQSSKGHNHNNQRHKNVRLPLEYYLSNFYPPEISSTFIKTTIYNEKMSKQEKKQIIKEFLDDIIIQILQQKKLL